MQRRLSATFRHSLVAGAIAVGCAANEGVEPDGAGAVGGSGGVAGVGAISGNSGSSGSSGSLSIDAGGSAGTGGYGAAGPKLERAPACNASGHVDGDGDGFFADEDDCNDCTPQVNPAALDWPSNGVDEDCNGTTDDEPRDCDATAANLAVYDASAAVRALGFCRVAGNPSFGLVSAAFVQPDGNAAPNGVANVSRGLMQRWGSVQPREGKNLLVLSTGAARLPGTPGYSDRKDTDTGTKGVAPAGYPVDSPSCSVQTSGDRVAYNPAGLELRVKTPSNANVVRFRFDFYTYEYPRFICSQNNDFFVALLDPAPTEALLGNVSFDKLQNPISVNAGFLEVCAPGTHYGKEFPCAAGTGELQGTGYETGAATGWLTTTAPVPPDTEITLRFALWDMGDAFYDSTVLLDALEFDVDERTTVTEPVQ